MHCLRQLCSSGESVCTFVQLCDYDINGPGARCGEEEAQVACPGLTGPRLRRRDASQMRQERSKKNPATTISLTISSTAYARPRKVPLADALLPGYKAQRPSIRGHEIAVDAARLDMEQAALRARTCDDGGPSGPVQPAASSISVAASRAWDHPVRSRTCRGRTVIWPWPEAREPWFCQLLTMGPRCPRLYGYVAFELVAKAEPMLLALPVQLGWPDKAVA